MFEVGCWRNDDEAIQDKRFDWFVTNKPVWPSRAERPEGKTVLRNFSMATSRYGVSWEPDRTWAQYIDSVDGWLCDDAGKPYTTRSGERIWNLERVDGHETMRIAFEWLRNNSEHYDGMMLEMLFNTAPWDGWSPAWAWEMHFDRAMEIVRRRGERWVITLNGRHDTFVPKCFLSQVDYNKLEGMLWGPYFADRKDSHDRDGGKRIDGPGYWIERMCASPCIAEAFTQEAWAAGIQQWHRNVTAALAAIYDAVYIGHLDNIASSPSHWNQDNPWDEIYDRLRALGEPTMEPIRRFDVHARQFEHGLLMVNTAPRATKMNTQRLGPYGYAIV